MAKQIIVVDNGFVFIGNVTPTPVGYLVEDCSCVRAWGTTNGLGQIALTGPTSETILDPCGTIEVEKHATLFRIDCVV